MDKIKKLLSKVSKKDRERILCIVEKLLEGRQQGLNISKIHGTDFYRIRSGRFRMIYHMEEKNTIIIDSIRLRNESTYKKDSM